MPYPSGGLYPSPTVYPGGADMAAGDIHALMTLNIGSGAPIIVGNNTTGQVRSGPTTGTVR